MTTASIPNSQLTTDLFFLEKDEKHKSEKPYKLQYDAGDALPRTNTVNKEYGPIHLEDIRYAQKALSFEKNGFAVVDMPSQMAAEDFYDASTVRGKYYAELKALLLIEFGATRVEILEHLVSTQSIPLLEEVG